jgi:hypothetical protein
VGDGPLALAGRLLVSEKPLTPVIRKAGGTCIGAIAAGVLFVGTSLSAQGGEGPEDTHMNYGGGSCHSSQIQLLQTEYAELKREQRDGVMVRSPYICTPSGFGGRSICSVRPGPILISPDELRGRWEAD